MKQAAYLVNFCMHARSKSPMDFAGYLWQNVYSVASVAQTPILPTILFLHPLSLSLSLPLPLPLFNTFHTVLVTFSSLLPLCKCMCVCRTHGSCMYDCPATFCTTLHTINTPLASTLLSYVHASICNMQIRQHASHKRIIFKSVPASSWGSTRCAWLTHHQNFLISCLRGTHRTGHDWSQHYLVHQDCLTHTQKHTYAHTDTHTQTHLAYPLTRG